MKVILDGGEYTAHRDIYVGVGRGPDVSDLLGGDWVVERLEGSEDDLTLLALWYGGNGVKQRVGTVGSRYGRDGGCDVHGGIPSTLWGGCYLLGELLINQ